METLESVLGYVDMGDEGVQLVRRVLILVTHAGKTDTQSVGNMSDTLLPDSLVQSGVNSHVLGAHGLLGKLADLLDGTGSAVLAANVDQTLVQVHGVLTGNDLIDGRGLIVLPGSHFRFYFSLSEVNQANLAWSV